MMKSLLVLSCLIKAGAFSTVAPAPERSGVVFDNLRSSPLVRASDSSPTYLPDQWRSSTPFGLGDETAHASKLRDDVLPAVDKIFFVGVGTGEAAAEFAKELGIDPKLCFGDDGGVAGDNLGLQQGFNTMWNPPAVSTMMERNDEDSLKALGEAYKNAADNIGIQKLAPKDIKDTLRQGGTFVFKGDKLLLEHYDQKVGDNAKISDILACLK
eukprot:scaffold29463_cov148-Skeletonema_menzelii.AAC.4